MLEPSPRYMQMSTCAYLISMCGGRVIASKMAEKKPQLLTDATPLTVLQEAALTKKILDNCIVTVTIQNSGGMCLSDRQHAW